MGLVLYSYATYTHFLQLFVNLVVPKLPKFKNNQNGVIYIESRPYSTRFGI